jgi:hypothetical protein
VKILCLDENSGVKGKNVWVWEYRRQIQGRFYVNPAEDVTGPLIMPGHIQFVIFYYLNK